MNIIQGDKFQKLAKWIYAPYDRAKDDYQGLVNTLDWVLLKNNDIVYTHTMYVRKLFTELTARGINKYFYLITHNSDINVDETFLIPWQVVKWYSQNVNCINPRLVSIPIGLENDRWMRKVDKLEIMRQHFACGEGRNLAYLNHNISTNVNERFPIYRLFEGKPWVTAVHGKNGHDFSGYIKDIADHAFTFCPNGNGMDTHRLWEVLYMGRFPIVKRDFNNRFYTDLPIVFVEEWDEVNECFLRSEYRRLTENTPNYTKLDFNYWKLKILRHE